MAAAETTPLVGGDPVGMLVKNAEAEVRMGFVRKVYGLLSVQLLVTTAIAAPFQLMTPQQVVAHQWILIVATVVMVSTMCAMCCCTHQLRKFPQNYMILGAITLCMGVIVGFTSAMYTWQSVILSAGLTVLIFLGMTVFAWTTKTDFTGLGPYFFAFLMTMSAFGFMLFILSLCGVHIQWMIMLYDVMAVLLFTFYIVFDTQMIIGGDHQTKFTIDDYAFAALNLYLDIINLFLHILSLLGERK